jgi:hypothetical protein
VKPPSPSGLYRDDKPVTDWPAIRAWVLNRDGHKCQTCKVSVATEVDHLWPRRLGGSDHIDNLKAICGPCNKAKGARVDLAGATEAQLRLADAALRARIRSAEIEHHEVVNERIRRFIATRNRRDSADLLADLDAEALSRASRHDGWRAAIEQGIPPLTRREFAAALREAHRLLTSISPEEAAALLNEDHMAEVRQFLHEVDAFVEHLRSQRAIP